MMTPEQMQLYTTVPCETESARRRRGRKRFSAGDLTERKDTTAQRNGRMPRLLTADQRTAFNSEVTRELRPRLQAGVSCRA
jgi:hypothetical protein